ncbi:protein disulfide-isomerase A3-like [Bombina bombina]|uniref:protein disulfide-isomerase A3-like n=1 Tax=Bombina bombina TaxID=8345 RepID=UPI00235B204C|nr:protein disulfide-isomerase A3-like [Bombina bombina]
MALLLDDNRFQTQLYSQKVLFVEFFTPRCGQCMRLVPEFEEAAIRLDGFVALATVDCMIALETCALYQITKYPTIKLFKRGIEAGTYHGSFTAASIVQYIKKQINPNSQEIKSLEQLNTLIRDPEASIVGFFSDRRNPNLFTFLKADNALEIYRFAFTCAPQLLERHVIDKEGIILFRSSHLNNKFEDNAVRFKGTISVSRIKKFIQKNIFGLCPIMTLENSKLLREKDLLMAFYNVDYNKNPRGTSYWRNRIMMVAKKFQDAGEKLSYSIANWQEFSFELPEYGIHNSSGDVPAVAIRTLEGHKYVMREEFTRDGKALERFLQQYFNGKVKRYYRSQPIPEQNLELVKIIVADNFNKIVNNREKDVLIYFYAPWCSLCKSLEPKYKELAKKLRNDPHVVIAKMDAIANDVPPPYDITGFPTIYFVPTESKHAPKLYEGDWRVKDLLSYLERKSTYQLVIENEEMKKKDEL